MDQRKKSALLGMLLLLMPLCVGTGIAVGDEPIGSKGGSGSGTAEKQEMPSPSVEADRTAIGTGEVTPAQKSPRTASEAAIPQAAAGSGDAQLNAVEEVSDVGGQPKSQTSAALQEPGGSQKDVKQQTGTGVEPVPFSREDAFGGDVGEVPLPPAKTDPAPVAIEPDFVRALTGIDAGRNDSNPVWSPSGTMIAFERSIGDNREIVVARSDGSIIQKIQCRPADDGSEMEFFMPGIVEETSYNSGISWSPDESRLVFMSNGGSGNYDLYLLPALGKETTIRLTKNTEKDSHPHWSPVDGRLAFVSGRSGKAEIYLMDLVSRQVSVLTNGAKTYLYPQWSPDGRRLSLMYGSNENHDIYLIEDLQQPSQSLKALTTWQYDDLRPVWSPDGSKIAFYSNYNPASDPKVWSIVVVAADGSDPTAGEELAARVVARNVVPDVERGPAWMPDSRRIAFVRNDPKSYNPIFIAHIDNGTEMALRTETKMNHDVVCSKTGILAFRSQTDQWDHIYVARLKEEVARREPQ